MSERRGGIAYLGVITPIIFGTTYLLTTDFLPPGRPLLVALGRSLPTGVVLVIGSKLPPRGWWWKFAVLSVLYASAFFPLLFVAAYRLPGGVAAVINSIGPIATAVLSIWLLRTPIRAIQVVAGLVGVGGVALLVLSSSARLDGWGVLAMVSCVIMLSAAAVLTKRWGKPDGFTARGMTGWTFLIGGVTLIPFVLIFEGLPAQLSGREIGGFVYLGLISGVVGYGMWFWALERLSPSAVMFLGLVNPVVAAALGWIFLGQRLNGLQLFGAALVLVAVVLGQLGPRRGASAPPETAVGTPSGSSSVRSGS